MADIDYDALAKQYGGSDVTAVDYDALAKKHGGVDVVDPGVLGAIKAGASHGFDSLAAGGKQLFRGVFGDSATGAIDKLGASLGMANGSNLEQQQAPTDPSQLAYQSVAAQHPIASAVGNALPYMATADPLVMAGMGALDYGTPAERGVNAATSFVGGKAGQAVGNVLGRVLGGPLSADVATATNKWNIPTSVGQDTGNKAAKIAESVLSNVPVVGGIINRGQDRTFSAFNKALSNTIGENSSQITPDLLGSAMDRSGSKIGDIMGRARAQLTPQQAQDVAQLSGVIGDLGAEGAPLTAKLGKVIDGMTNGQALSGQTLRMLDTSLGRLMASPVGDVRYAAAHLQNIVRDAATASLAAEDAAALTTARSQNFNARQLADATKATPGSISPSQLLTQVNKFQKSAKYGGGNELAELAQWGKQTLGSAIPDSGTAQRSMYQKALTSPLTTLGALGGGYYGLEKAGVTPQQIAEGSLLPLLMARGLAAKPLSATTKSVLSGSGSMAGLLGAQSLPPEWLRQLLGQQGGQ